MVGPVARVRCSKQLTFANKLGACFTSEKGDFHLLATLSKTALGPAGAFMNDHRCDTR